MSHWGGAKLGIRLRDVMAVLTLVSHLFATIGFPLPAPSSARLKDASRPFPCQNRPCGCLTYDECWKGDCCCFTLEEKLAWAEANGIDLPEHVRPLVEARKTRPVPPKKKSCCSESESSPESPPASLNCCQLTESVPSNCCSQGEPCDDGAATTCPQCAAKASSKCSEKKKLATEQQQLCWVIGIFAQKCRGEGPAGLMKLDPSVPPDTDSRPLAVPEPSEFLDGFHPIVTSTSHSPPTPPPRRS